jgi:hypothetical protein
MKRYLTKSLFGMIAIAMIILIAYSFLYIQPEAMTAILTFSILMSLIGFAARSAAKLKSKQTVR